MLKNQIFEQFEGLMLPLHNMFKDKYLQIHTQKSLNIGWPFVNFIWLNGQQTEMTLADTRKSLTNN